MITEIKIENYKSIEKLTLPLGRVNVFIGENGAGKSNILEIIALAGAASAKKLDNEFLGSRGIRVTNPSHMRHAFSVENSTTPIKIEIKNLQDEKIFFTLQNNNAPYSKWIADIRAEDPNLALPPLSSDIIDEFVSHLIAQTKDHVQAKQTTIEHLNHFIATLKNALDNHEKKESKNPSLKIKFENENEFVRFLSNSKFYSSETAKILGDFIIFSPENTALRTFKKEGQIEPLGINGEGVLQLLSVYFKDGEEQTITKIKKSLKMLGWFEDLKILEQTNEARLEICDRYLSNEIPYFEYTSANEGFFFLLFYFLLFNSKLTPSFFAIDNIDASLNPKLCEKLIMELVKLSKENGKQVILTTHNPAILDGLNLDDDEQRLFVISRGRTGSTKIKRVMKPTRVDADYPYRLSEMFLRGMLGGLPKGF